MRLELFQSHAAIGIGIDFLEDFLGLGGVLLSPRTGLELIKADGAAAVGVELLEYGLRRRALALARAVWSTGTVRTFGWLILSEAQRRGDCQGSEGVYDGFHDLFCFFVQCPGAALGSVVT